MEQTQENEQLTPEKGYEPRPAWQLWAARIGLVVFLILVVAQIVSIAGAGL